MNSYSIFGNKDLLEKSAGLIQKAQSLFDSLTPLGDLLLRCWVAYAFWVSGLTKIQTWDSTLYLFQYEYSVPLFSPEIAAYLGTFVELAAPVLLAFGLCGRGAAAILFLFNIVAVVSYSDLGDAGLEQHIVWGIMLLVSLLHGPGKWSVDAWIITRFFKANI